ncbi:hypothetical protein SPHINGO391_390375 [Sphingomonas aurantiaca]|uniref:Uncharacterized protein n=1 Tax=Sphingomonas aurantiaca TaxID=185949 RepID=A0A5E7YT13_9SPHN|nr:hypothetical protein SPHINGO391_390375 [Sphingomonas aurantiaca]
MRGMVGERICGMGKRTQGSTQH